MGYCATQNGRAPDDWSPTARDLLGMEMLYPADRLYPVACEQGCLYTAAGLVVRASGTVTSDWTRRGGVGVVMQSGTSSGTTLPVAGLPSGTSWYSYTFTEPRGAQLVGGAWVNKSDALHTAILSVVLLRG
jgi:hypothetical protein